MMAQAGLQAPSPAELLAAVAASAQTSLAEDNESRIQRRRFEPESHETTVFSAAYAAQESDARGRHDSVEFLKQEEEYGGQEYEEPVADDENDIIHGVAKGKEEYGGADPSLSFGSKEAAIASSLLALETASHLLELEQQREEEAQEEAERDLRMNGERLFEEEQAGANGGFSRFNINHSDAVQQGWGQEELDERAWAARWGRGVEDAPASPKREAPFLPPGIAEPQRGRRSDNRRPRRFVEPLELVWKVPESEAKGSRPRKPKRQKGGGVRARNSSLGDGVAAAKDSRLVPAEGVPQEESQGPEFEEEVIVSDPNAPLGLPLARVKRLMKESAKECHVSSLRKAASLSEASRQGREAGGDAAAFRAERDPALQGRGALEGAEPAGGAWKPRTEDSDAPCLAEAAGERGGGLSAGRQQQQQQEQPHQGNATTSASTHPASISTEAAHIMAKATELFLMKFAHSTARTMLKADDGRSSLLYRHVGGTVASEGYLSFLADLVPQKVKFDQIQPFSFLPGAWAPPAARPDQRSKEHHGSLASD